MVRILSFSYLSDLALEVRGEKRGFITNFFPDHRIHQEWIDKGSLLYDKIGSTVFLMHLVSSYANLYFFSPTVNDLDRSLQEAIFPDTELFFEIIGPKEKTEDILNVVIHAGFRIYRVLGRMWKKTETVSCPSDDRIVFAIEEDAGSVLKMLEQNFDKRIESIPEESELLELIKDKGVLISRSSEGELLGSLIFEKTPSTQHLRFWVTAPMSRNRQIGSGLMRRFLYEGNSTKRQILWVMQDNLNAIQMYEHYGFKSENMFDFYTVKGI